MGFIDPIVGGISLRIPAIRSPNYVPGVSGWTINIDGSAEFNNLTIRGEFFGTDFIIENKGIFFYSGPPANGNLVLSIAATAGTDDFGNTFPSGFNITESGKAVVLGLTGGSPLLYFVTGLAATFNSAAIQGIIQGAGTGQYDWLQILSAQDSTQNTLMLAALSGASADGTVVPGFHVQYKDAGGVFHELLEISPTGIALNLPVSIESEFIQVFTADATPMISQSNTTITSNSGFIMQIHDTAGSIGFKCQVSGDAHSRFILSANGEMQFGAGTLGVDTTLERVAAGILATLGNFLIGGSSALGDNGVGELQLANATTVPTTNPTGGGVLYEKQGVPTHRDPGGQLLGMVRSYSADSTSNLASFTAETDVPGATINVVVTGSNATVIVHGQFDMMIGTTAGTTMVGLLSWNGVDRTEQVVMITPTVGARNCLARTWRITGVTAGTYVAKLRATCTASAANNLVEATHTGLTVEVIDQ